MDLKIKAVLWGGLAVIGVLLVNLIVLSLLGFPLMAVEIIKRYFILLILLIGGFGLQVGLFVYFKSLNALSCSTTIASGGISTFSMILCCSHYLINILPFLGALVGFSGLMILTKYIPYFLWFGIISNALGIAIIYYQVKKHKSKNEK